ncbi:MAG: DNA adenine methylase, partial [Methanoregula sp.]|nr:DNA adenine methylase [Methanoregula sp.]
MKAPFPYFGGKSAVAPVVWAALGQPKHYIEPFFGSGAVLLNRPDYNPIKHMETINDKDGYVANVWRALQH